MRAAAATLSVWDEDEVRIADEAPRSDVGYDFLTSAPLLLYG